MKKIQISLESTKHVKTESIRKLSNFNFHWTKTLYQNDLNHIAFSNKTRKEFLAKMLKLEGIFTSIAIKCHRHEGLAVLQMFALLFCLEHVKTLKSVREKLSTSKFKTKRRSTDEK